MTFTLPQDTHELLIMLAPMLTLLLGVAFLVFPGSMLRFLGLEARPGNPGAKGEGRSSFAGPLIASSLACLLLQEPIALQPGLNLILTIAWALAAFGFLLQMIIDGGLYSTRLLITLVLSVLMAAASAYATEIPFLACLDNLHLSCFTPQDTREQLLSAVALFTTIMGLAGLLVPRMMLWVLGLQPRSGSHYASGATRGTWSGFFIAVGGVYLMMPQPVDFVALVMGAVWLLNGLGRLASTAFDQRWSLYNIIWMLIELGLGIAVLSTVLRLI